MKNFCRLTQAVLRLLDKEKDDLDVGGMLGGPWAEIKDFGPMPKRSKKNIEHRHLHFVLSRPCTGEATI